MCVLLENILESIEITLSHSLDNEVCIVREKEEAATLTLGLTCFKDTVSIILRTQALLYQLGIYAIKIS